MVPDDRTHPREGKSRIDGLTDYYLLPSGEELCEKELLSPSNDKR
jgi:hypothetical protein